MTTITIMTEIINADKTAVTNTDNNGNGNSGNDNSDNDKNNNDSIMIEMLQLTQIKRKSFILRQTGGRNTQLVHLT